MVTYLNTCMGEKFSTDKQTIKQTKSPVQVKK